MTPDIFEDTWDEVEVSPETAMSALAATLSNLQQGGHSYPPSYVARFLKQYSTSIESIIGSKFSVKRVQTGGITFYTVEVEDD